ncbi:MAG: D-aminoacyl-tRNA deacylase [Candidatus Bathyarchaeia archaeon]
MEKSRINAIIVALDKDLAAQNISKKLIANYGFKETFSNSLSQKVFLKENAMLLISSDHKLIPKIEALKPEIVIFASRHESKANYPTFTVHATGSLNDLKTLSFAHPQRMKTALLALKNEVIKRGLNRFSISLEATHHGPLSPNIPIMFVEIGSTKLEWINDEAGEVAAFAIWNSAISSSNGIPCVGFGGGHYAIKHTELTLNTDYAIGHIFPKYFFSTFDSKIIKQAFEKTVGKCKTAVIDWKGIKGSSNRNSLIKLLKEFDIEIVRV